MKIIWVKKEILTNIKTINFYEGLLSVNLKLLGEAINKIKKIQKIDIQFHKQMIGLRNKIIHSYDNVDDIIMWGIITKHLPVLKLEIENLINKK